MATAVGSKNGKAYLIIKEASPDGGKSQIGQLDFQYNPEKLEINKTSNWNNKDSKPAEKGSTPEFTGAEPRTMSVEIFLDAAERPSYDLNKDIKMLFDCCGPTDKSIQQKNPSPPFVTFGWGKTMQFEAIVTSVKVTLVLFSPEGQPLRAKCVVALKEVPSAKPGQNPTSGSVAARRTHIVVDGDSLASIAYQEYRDPRLWRALAETNKIDDPLRLTAGATLLIPDIEEASAFR